MRKMILRLSCGNGTDSADAYLVSEQDYQDWKAEKDPCELNDYAWTAAVEHAESYGVYLPSDDEEDEEENHNGFTGSDIEGWWEEYDPKEHDGLWVGYQTEWTFQEL